MDCNLTDKDREKGMSCRGWDCQGCKEYKLSTNDISIINLHMTNMELKKEIHELRTALRCCKNDYWFMTNLLEKYSSDIEKSVRDCIVRMNTRKPIFNILKEGNNE